MENETIGQIAARELEEHFTHLASQGIDIIPVMCAGIRAGLEAAAKVADDAILFPYNTNDSCDITARDIAAAIRKLKGDK